MTGHSNKHTPLSSEQRWECFCLHKAGAPMADIAKQFGVSMEVLSGIVARGGK